MIPQVMQKHLWTIYLSLQLMRKLLHQLVKGPHRQLDIMHQMETIGIGSLPIITIATGFTGLVMTSEIAWHMDFALSNVSMIPGFTGQFVIRELGIAVPPF